ncbi:TPA: LysR substrate-binding domain-containing protein [Klebsiella aerogenes]|uniref:LysR substrate-binding domain-containing protein n=1 Tax=Klebsiella TaxID=570 RepID=UPI000B41600B|nr:LysR family transcriptional regulator [Klebsiella aerogenes]EKZ9670474.1 LysR family transcriptional regulator [Klebsiella aerogenes]ELT7620079.1 LysR family transcriptional regulator [Klebsiella aerogenes]ELY3086013.1 LysR family transcriptional regulator [Klebsiella aerogenes]MDA3990470.1 LysR family transcriptional regulator [Klebsiella aerogenes]MDQ8581138.1 LysR family transcriptional regulator [Klebsiella aerogenes]
MANWTQKLKLQHLKMLVALGEQGNLTQVAKMMNITQPALSKWLTQFEEEVGMPLFERHSKGLRPSEGGKLLLQHAQRLINDMSRSQYEIERFKQGGLVGSLMVGCSPVATDCVAQAILALLKEMPTLHLNIEEKVMTPLLHDLLSGVVDVVVGRVGGRALELPLNYRVLYTEPVCFVARPDHPLASMPRLSWADLAVWRWIVWPTGTPIRQSIDNALVDNGVMLPENTIESASMNVTSNLLQSSDMISILSLRLAQHYAEHRQLTILNLPRIEQKGSVGVFWRKSEVPSLALTRFLHYLAE